MPSAVYNPEVIRQSFLTDEEKEIYKAINFKQFFNADMEHELLQSYQNDSKSVNLPVSNDDRDIDTVLEQTRKALMKSGNKPPYILMPHSISGIEAMYWAQKYPKEIKAIPKETPVLILDAVSDQNRHSKYAIQNRKDYEAFAAQFNTADIKELRGTHSIYLYQPDQIYKLSMEFMRKVR